ncbi:MAG: hypothetical protein ACLU2K_04265 [Clostridia bacterium]|jgi:hypothetical protein|uniref:hypothetical protein n=1 Tax=Huintestinicola butyrica TaxID=2981728 RepID=UPI00082354C5|nr:hypothetical protein [Huintestinicola butyrica]MBS6592090.1 hypothetical protein [Ruminococcus sp.]MCU6728912.1 hypothetical protein [Huintestinicola butyrica]SCJ28994.1 Uncharacterised protein [uncultured Ruminococcus sp.]
MNDETTFTDVSALDTLASSEEEEVYGTMVLELSEQDRETMQEIMQNTESIFQLIALLFVSVVLFSVFRILWQHIAGMFGI